MHIVHKIFFLPRAFADVGEKMVITGNALVYDLDGNQITFGILSNTRDCISNPVMTIFLLHPQKVKKIFYELYANIQGLL